MNRVYDFGLCETCGATDGCACSQTAKPIVRQMFRGDAFQFYVQFMKMIAPNTPLVPLDITSYKIYFTMKRTTNDPDNQALAQVSSLPSSTPAGGSVTKTQPTAGWVLVTVPAPATALFPDGETRVPYDVKGIDPSGLPVTAEAGVLLVIPNVTRAST